MGIVEIREKAISLWIDGKAIIFGHKLKKHSIRKYVVGQVLMSKNHEFDVKHGGYYCVEKVHGKYYKVCYTFSHNMNLLIIKTAYQL